MVDPFSLGAAAAGKALSAGEGEGKQWLLSRMLGPAADEIGAWLGQKAHDRLHNADRIANAARKKAGDRDGTIPPRVVKEVLEDGTWVDDELAAEYFGGMLAASVTPTGRDDRAIGWTKVIAAMSVLEIRLHYLLYQEWWSHAATLSRDDIDLNFLGGEGTGVLFVDGQELTRRLLETLTDNPTEDEVDESWHLFLHASSGLHRHELADRMGFAYGDARRVEAESIYKVEHLPFDFAVRYTPSSSGIELWGFAHGIDNLTSANFGIAARTAALDSVIPRLSQVVFS